MALIDPKRVNEILNDCFFTNEEAKEVIHKKMKCLIIPSLSGRFIINPEKIEKHEPEIHEILMNLPEGFREESPAEGLSFIEMPMDKEGNQWGEQNNANELMILGLASGWLISLVPHQMWGILPGGVPMLRIYTNRHKRKSRDYPYNHH